MVAVSKLINLGTTEVYPGDGVDVYFDEENNISSIEISNEIILHMAEIIIEASKKRVE